jgi:NAD(P)H-hydrate epimerase
LVGPGNNGGDGLVIARALQEQGRRPRVILFTEKLSADAERQKALAQAWGVDLNAYHSSEQDQVLHDCLDQSQVIVDALFGTGLSRPLEGRFRHAVEQANKRETTRVAIDIASGINGETGQVLGAALKADITITFGCLKRGHLLHPGKLHGGTVHLTQPGFHPEALERFDKIQLFTRDWARRLLPTTWETMHKGDNGRILLLTGSEQYPGAGILTVIGALKAGGGLGTQSTPKALVPSLLRWAPEAMPIHREEGLPDTASFNALVVGSGLGKEVESEGLKLLENSSLPAVVDADALSLIQNLSPSRRKNLILTPHPGELGKMLERSAKELEKDRIRFALEAAERFGAVVCYKGSPTITATPEGKAYVNSTGNAVLAQGGSGDLLSGIIGAYLGYGLPCAEASACGAFIHGLAADLAAAKLGPRGVTAHQIAELVPIAYRHGVGNPSPFPVF